MDENIFSLAPGSTIVGYLRDSGGPEQELSVRRQLVEYERFCEQQQLRSVRVFSDEAKSGKFSKNRNEFLEMVAFLTADPPPAVQGIACWSSARFSRNPDDAPFYRALLRRQGYKLLYISQDVVDIGEYTPVVEALHDVMNAKYVVQMAKEIRSGLHHSMSLGAFVGTTPTGFRRVPLNLGDNKRNGKPRMVSRLEPREDLAPLILKAFEMRAAGYTLEQIHAVTHLFNCKRPASSYTRMMRNPIYKGTYAWAGERIENYVEPIVPAEVWDQAQEVGHQARLQLGIYHRRRAGNEDYALTGLVNCPRCNLPMWIHSSRRQRKPGGRVYDYRYYVCQNSRMSGEAACSVRVRAADVEAATFAQLEQDCLREEAIVELEKRLKARAQQGDNGRAKLLKSKTAQLAKLEKEIANLVQAGTIAKFSKALGAALVAKEAEAESTRHDIEEIKNGPAARYDIDIRQTTDQLKRALASGNPQQIRRAVGRLVHHIDARRTGVVVWYHEFLKP